MSTAQPLFLNFNAPSLSEMTMITLYCLIHNEPITNAFPIEIDENKTVGILKEMIKLKKAPRSGYTADRLVLWRVNIPDTTALKELVLKDNKEKGVQELIPMWKISKVFPKELSEDCTHIIVVPPVQESNYGMSHCFSPWQISEEVFSYSTTCLRMFYRCRKAKV